MRVRQRVRPVPHALKVEGGRERDARCLSAPPGARRCRPQAWWLISRRLDLESSRVVPRPVEERTRCDPRGLGDRGRHQRGLTDSGRVGVQAACRRSRVATRKAIMCSRADVGAATSIAAARRSPDRSCPPAHAASATLARSGRRWPSVSRTRHEQPLPHRARARAPSPRRRSTSARRRRRESGGPTSCGS